LLDVTLVILCAGNSTRFEKMCKKQWLRVANEPLWLNVSKRLSSYSNFSKIIVVSHKDELKYMKNFSDDYIFIEGGNSRQNSIKNALVQVDTKYVMISDVARACISKKIVLNLLENKEKFRLFYEYVTKLFNERKVFVQNLHKNLTNLSRNSSSPPPRG